MLQIRYKEISDLRERIEIVHTAHYQSFLTHLFPSLEGLLTRPAPQGVNPSIGVTDVSHLVRQKTLEVLNRLPNNEALKPYANRLFEVCLDVLRRDNEENAIVALRIVFELQRNFRAVLEQRTLQAFFEIVRDLYAKLESNVQLAFSASSLETGIISSDASSSSASSSTTTITAATTTSGGEDVSASGNEPKSLKYMWGHSSFRVMIETPLIVMLLLQLNPNFTKTEVQALLPLMLRCLRTRIPSSANTLTLTPHGTRVKQSRFECFVSSQVKTLSFLTFLLLTYTQAITNHRAEIVFSVVSLLQIVPAESLSTRRELLVATRHILATELHHIFAPHLNSLLDEAVLLGTRGGRFDKACVPVPDVLPTAASPQTQPLNPTAGGVQVRVSVRKQPLVQLAYTALADLVQQMRTKMDLAQISRVVYLFSRNVHDAALPFSMQATSVRLLLNLVDGIYHHPEPGLTPAPAGPPKESNARVLLVKIMDALVRKLGTIRHSIPKVAAAERRAEAAAANNANENAAAAPMVSAEDDQSPLLLLARKLTTYIISCTSAGELLCGENGIIIE